MYGNDFDVTDRVKTTDPASVNREVDRLFIALYPGASTSLLDRVFSDVHRLYRGHFAGYRACDTPYHDIQHVLDVTLATARLIDGYERGRADGDALGRELFELGIITALLHDSGYICRERGEQYRQGAEFTLTHVSRGAGFLKEYLATLGLARMADVAAELIHFTGYERLVRSIPVTGLTRRLGNMLGSADIIAQMSDRCYLEKCRDRLYPEFVAGGLASRRNADGTSEVVYASGEDLLRKTLHFYEGATRRLQEDLAGGFSYAQHHFGGQNLYIEGVEKNIRFVETVREEGAGILKRQPPNTQRDGEGAPKG
jgi:hypothetical protein